MMTHSPIRRREDRNRLKAGSALIVLGLALAGCGGDGGDVNSVSSVAGPTQNQLAPQTDTTTQTDPAPSSDEPREFLRSESENLGPLSDRAGFTDGTYGLKAIIDETQDGVRTSRILDPGKATLQIDYATKTYTFTVDEPGYPSGQAFNLQHPYPSSPAYETGFGYRFRTSDYYSDGSVEVKIDDFDMCCGAPVRQISADRGQLTAFEFKAGHQYVSWGIWYDTTVALVPGSNGGFASDPSLPSKRIAFVQGIRTGPGDLPVSGNASYVDDAGFLHFDADFAAQTIGARIDVEPYLDEHDLRWSNGGITASGSAPILSSGDFFIPLSGSYFTPDGSPDGTLTGTVDGAFYGPQAAEIGGVYQLFRDGVLDRANPFTGTQVP